MSDQLHTRLQFVTNNEVRFELSKVVVTALANAAAETRVPCQAIVVVPVVQLILDFIQGEQFVPYVLLQFCDFLHL